MALRGFSSFVLFGVACALTTACQQMAATEGGDATGESKVDTRPETYASGGGNSLTMALNPWWPMTPGNKWHFAKSDNGHPLTIEILPSPATFGCATNPIHVFFRKQHEDAYWGPDTNMNLHWILGAQPNGQIMGYGHYVEDLQGNPGTDTMNYRTNTAGVPAYYLIPGNPKHQQSSTSRHSLPATEGITNSCIPGDNNYFSTWNVSWAYDTVSVPGYTGPALRASYDEQSGGRQIEDWYFVHGLGVVRIVAKNPDGTAFVDMRLTSYELVEPNTYLNRRPGAAIPTRVIPSATLNVGTSPNPTPRTDVLNVNVGQTLYYSWTSSSAVSVNSFYSTDGSDGCPNGFLESDVRKPWVANTLNGTYSALIPPCMAGHTYSMTVQAISSSGHITPKTVTFKVGHSPAQPTPVAVLGLNPAGTQKYIEVDPGQNITYYHNVQNAARTETYYYATAPDRCPGGWSSTDLRKSWSSVPINSAGSIAGVALDCQAARAYTIVLLAYSANNRQVARDQVTVFIRGSAKQRMDAAAVSQPRNQWIWSWWYNQFVGASPGPIEDRVEVNPAKSAIDIPLYAWWDCMVDNNCAEMSALFEPAAPSPYINRRASSALNPSVNGQSYVTIKGLNMSPDGNNTVLSNCNGVQRTHNNTQGKSYDGPDGGGSDETTQINVFVPSPGIATDCTFQVVRPDGTAGNIVTLRIAAAPMQAPTIDDNNTKAGGACGCGCAWIMGNHFYSGAIEVHVRKANATWDSMGTAPGLWVSSLNTLQFNLTSDMKTQFMNQGLRFTVFNAVINEWVTSEPIVCTP
ncbi:MAG: hypothetical protein K2X47_02140 [Bdellovibrionales bacterium]|nr:hypothetical protein [Bdellovibrionales bacterium]